jgi:hypothetical protein
LPRASNDAEKKGKSKKVSRNEKMSAPHVAEQHAGENEKIRWKIGPTGIKVEYGPTRTSSLQQ